MSSTPVLIDFGKHANFERVSIECPFCHSRITPDYLFYHRDTLFALCSNSNCGKHLMLQRDSWGKYTVVAPNSLPKSKSFSTIIKEISPSFDSIYNQAFCAEQLSLDQICGVGYRKALEFLIKDYLISTLESDAEKEAIKKKPLGSCIQDDISDSRIKQVAKRATWLGNDETHYVRKWDNKDVSNLKDLIDLTIRWMESEIETRRLLEEMPESR